MAAWPGEGIAGGPARRDEVKIKDLKYDVYQPEYAGVLPMAVGLYGISAMMPCFGSGILVEMERLKGSALLNTSTATTWDSGCGGDGGD